MYSIDFTKSTTAYGRIEVNATGAEFDIDAPKGGDLVFAHANSVVYLTVDGAMSIQGELNRDHQPISKCVYKVDDNIIGELTNNTEVTKKLSLLPGNHILEITAKNNANAHTFWRIISEIPINNEKKVVKTKIVEVKKDSSESPHKRGRRKVQNEN